MPSEFDPMRVIDHATGQSDRWLFIALLVVLLIIGYYLWRYMADRLKAERDANREMAAQMSQTHKEMTAQMIAQAMKMADIAANCSAALRETTTALQRNTEAVTNNTRAYADIMAVLTTAQSNISRCIQLHYIQEARVSGKAVPPLSPTP